MEKRLLIIVNSHSGKKKKFNTFEAIQKQISAYGWETDMVFTKHSGHAITIAAEAQNYNRIVCVGGDGTLSEVCNGILKSNNQKELGYIPTGSTNDFARGIGLPKKIKNSTAFACTGTPIPIDIGSFTNEYGDVRFFSYVASFGAFTKISYSTAQRFKNRFGHFAYIFEGLKSLTDLQNFKPFKLKIETETGIIDGEYIFGAITNSTSLGGLVKLDKKSVTVNDGLFEMLLIKKPRGIIALTDTVNQLLNKKYNRSKVIFEHTKKVKLISEEPLEWTLDGEYAGKTAKVEISVLNNALNFIRPEMAKKHTFSRKKKI